MWSFCMYVQWICMHALKKECYFGCWSLIFFGNFVVFLLIYHHIPDFLFQFGTSPLIFSDMSFYWMLSCWLLRKSLAKIYRPVFCKVNASLSSALFIYTMFRGFFLYYKLLSLVGLQGLSLAKFFRPVFARWTPLSSALFIYTTFRGFFLYYKLLSLV